MGMSRTHFIIDLRYRYTRREIAKNYGSIDKRDAGSEWDWRRVKRRIKSERSGNDEAALTSEAVVKNSCSSSEGNKAIRLGRCNPPGSDQVFIPSDPSAYILNPAPPSSTVATYTAVQSEVLPAGLDFGNSLVFIAGFLMMEPFINKFFSSGIHPIITCPIKKKKKKIILTERQHYCHKYLKLWLNILFSDCKIFKFQYKKIKRNPRAIVIRN